MTKKILICDDVEEIRMLLKLALDAHEDLEVVGEASDGLEAVSRAQELAPDIVLLDVNMPRKNGFEALSEIRGHLPAAKIIMFTGFESGVLAATASSLGADDYIEKGTPLEEIVRRIRTIAGA